MAILALGVGVPEKTGLDLGAFMRALAGGRLRSAALRSDFLAWPPDFLARPKTFEPMTPQPADGD